MEDSRAYFECSRINTTTFVILERDKYEEYPFIYVKLYDGPPLVVISDTGCGGPDRHQIRSSNHHGLRDFIETSPILPNGDKPLNPRDTDGKVSRKYIIICTHCHYDHILGLDAFQDSYIIASSLEKAFVQHNLAENSLCKFVPVPVPIYQVSPWAADNEWLFSDGAALNLQILHTPGHTPDQLAWYDKAERHLYVGDSFYERVAKDKSFEQAIIFPNQGSIVRYMQTLEKLLAFVEERNAETGEEPVKVGCGHMTASADAKSMILEVRQLFRDIIAGKVPIVHSEEKRGEEFATWKKTGEPRFSVAAPTRLTAEAKESFVVS